MLTQGPLIETVPIGNAAMDDRTFIEWDKDDIDELKIMKVDVLALGMLTAIQRGFDMIERHYGRDLDLATMPEGGAAASTTCCARPIRSGVFQVESRAQMSMLPRFRPREFYDLVVEVAIVRPGPIQGNMVHPYLSRRDGQRAGSRRKRADRSNRVSRAVPRTWATRTSCAGCSARPWACRCSRSRRCASPWRRRSSPATRPTGLRRAMATFRHNGTIHPTRR